MTEFVVSNLVSRRSNNLILYSFAKKITLYTELLLIDTKFTVIGMLTKCPTMRFSLTETK